MALDDVIKEGLLDVSKVAVVEISLGGFLKTHLIGQDPDRFAMAKARNPVCNLSLMIGTIDIPDWCYAVDGNGAIALLKLEIKFIGYSYSFLVGKCQDSIKVFLHVLVYHGGTILHFLYGKYEKALCDQILFIQDSATKRAT